MADPRSTSTRRAVLSYSQLKELTEWPDLLLKDYQGILQDFVFTADEIDFLDARVTINEEDIAELKADVIDLQLRVAALEYRVYENVSTTTSLTTEEFQIILCKNTSASNSVISSSIHSESI